MGWAADAEHMAERAQGTAEGWVFEDELDHGRIIEQVDQFGLSANDAVKPDRQDVAQPEEAARQDVVDRGGGRGFWARRAWVAGWGWRRRRAMRARWCGEEPGEAGGECGEARPEQVAQRAGQAGFERLGDQRVAQVDHERGEAVGGEVLRGGAVGVHAGR